MIKGAFLPKGQTGLKLKMKMILTLLVLPMFAIAEDWSRTFQWGTNACGVIFEDTNLTADVKEVIRSDVAYFFSFVPTNRLCFGRLPKNHKEYGLYTGFLHTSPEISTNGTFYGTQMASSFWLHFPCSNYRDQHGVSCFIVATDVSNDYLRKIAWTNQCQDAIRQLPAFLYSVNHAKFNPLSNAGVMPLWSYNGMCPLLLSKIEERSSSPSLGNALISVNEVASYFGAVSVCLPTLYSFKLETGYDEDYSLAKDNRPDTDSLLSCEVFIRPKEYPDTISQYPALFVAGKWRLLYYDGE